jgi:DNA-binding Lrp family transcriptional regulator
MLSGAGWLARGRGGARALILLSRNPATVLREVAAGVGITERAVQRIIANLVEAGVLKRERVGRQNH